MHQNHLILHLLYLSKVSIFFVVVQITLYLQKNIEALERYKRCKIKCFLCIKSFHFYYYCSWISAKWRHFLNILFVDFGHHAEAFHYGAFLTTKNNSVKQYNIKGTVACDFRPLVFFQQSIPLGSLINRLNDFCIWWRILRYASLRGVDFQSRLSPRIRIYIRNRVSPWISGPRATVWRKKPEVENLVLLSL
jgi:hypothetical protein